MKEAEQGAAAFRAGKHMTDCPYISDPNQNAQLQSWRDGYFLARTKRDRRLLQSLTLGDRVKVTSRFLTTLDGKQGILVGLDRKTGAVQIRQDDGTVLCGLQVNDLGGKQ
jgi:hypothetical protein